MVLQNSASMGPFKASPFPALPSCPEKTLEEPAPTLPSEAPLQTSTHLSTAPSQLFKSATLSPPPALSVLPFFNSFLANIQSPFVSHLRCQDSSSMRQPRLGRGTSATGLTTLRTLSSFQRLSGARPQLLKPKSSPCGG